MYPKHIVASYFLIQAIGTVAWWVLLIAYPPSVKWFQPNEWPAESLLSFWLADFVMIIAGSTIAMTGVLRRSCWAGNVVWAVAVVTCLGLWSGVTMATRGNGTPLPTATAPRLVIAGPYRFVRNPMAVAGIVQGLAVGWYLGSYAVIVYSLTGAVLWQIAVRPVEESDLTSRFGETYHDYQRRVRLWIPTFGQSTNPIMNLDERECR